ncbi:hypothetical protein HMPREF0576_1134 [Mobiluncus holmesii ATCC 35242]|uniref:Uncharacterized protein n=1 Tax=Mobiluncus holmesii ATCC 35242 TaxID=887899 RepID=E6M4F2_9ACTO|nr:hypothetical protein HMPREF0576_1134 [Mobiluncus holmesii ATCC 35242]
MARLYLPHPRPVAGQRCRLGRSPARLMGTSAYRSGWSGPIHSILGLCEVSDHPRSYRTSHRTVCVCQCGAPASAPGYVWSLRINGGNDYGDELGSNCRPRSPRSGVYAGGRIIAPDCCFWNAPQCPVGPGAGIDCPETSWRASRGGGRDYGNFPDHVGRLCLRHSRGGHGGVNAGGVGDSPPLPRGVLPVRGDYRNAAGTAVPSNFLGLCPVRSGYGRYRDRRTLLVCLVRSVFAAPAGAATGCFPERAAGLCAADVGDARETASLFPTRESLNRSGVLPGDRGRFGAGCPSGSGGTPDRSVRYLRPAGTVIGTGGGAFHRVGCRMDFGRGAILCQSPRSGS